MSDKGSFMKKLIKINEKYGEKIARRYTKQVRKAMFRGIYQYIEDIELKHHNLKDVGLDYVARDFISSFIKNFVSLAKSEDWNNDKLNKEYLKLVSKKGLFLSELVKYWKKINFTPKKFFDYYPNLKEVYDNHTTSNY